MEHNEPTRTPCGVAPTKTDPHNVMCRKVMKRNYYENNGKEKSSLKYYKKKYKDDPDAASILQDINLDLLEKLKQIKAYHFNQKISLL